MWIKNFINECKAWKIVNKVYKENIKDFQSVGLKKDWFGKLYCVINRDPEIELGSDEDAVYLQNDLAKIWETLVRHNIVDILAYELRPLEEVIDHDDEGHEIYQHAYLVTLTPAWNLDRQYVSFKSVLFLTLFTGGFITGLVFLIQYLCTIW